jgi:hypothetical protein
MSVQGTDFTEQAPRRYIRLLTTVEDHTSTLKKSMTLIVEGRSVGYTAAASLRVH